MRLVRLIIIDIVILHILSLITAPLLFTIILGAGVIFTMQQWKEIKESKTADNKEDKK